MVTVLTYDEWRNRCFINPASSILYELSALHSLGMCVIESEVEELAREEYQEYLKKALEVTFLEKSNPPVV